MRKLVLFLFISLCLVGCEKEEVVQKENEEIKPFSLVSNEKRLVYDYSDLYYIVYEYNNNKITDAYWYYEYDTIELAKEKYNMINKVTENDEMIIEVKRDKNFVIAKLNNEMFKDKTVKDIKKENKNNREVK